MNRREIALLILYDPDMRFLLQHRSPDAGVLPGYWAFFGGGLEAGETPEQALRREVWEELRYRPASPQRFLSQDFKAADVSGKLHVFIEPFTGDKSDLQLHEGQGWGWFTYAQTPPLLMIARDRKILAALARHLARGGKAHAR